MTKIGWAALCLVAAALSACQTPYGETVRAQDPPVFETGMLASNELNRLGREQLAAGNSGKAEQYFRTAVEKDRDDAPSWIGLAAAYDKLGRFELADRAYGEAIRLQGESFVIVNNLGYSYLLRGDKRRALVQFERALALDPANPVVRNNIALLRAGERPNRASRL